jgi:hypothetical protein
MKRLLILAIILTLLTGQAAGDNTADNNLEHLSSIKSVKWAVQVDGMYPELPIAPDVDQWTLREGAAYEKTTFTFDVSKPANIKKAYLYIFSSAFDCITCELWTVRFNGNEVASGEHTSSQGSIPRGDGETGSPLQTTRFEVTNFVLDGENSVFIRGDLFNRKEIFFINGIMLVTFYETNKQHEYWIYDGVEYLQPSTIFDDFYYEEDLSGATYLEGSKGTLYAAVGIGNLLGHEDKDALYLNGNLLEPNSTEYLFDTDTSSRLDVLKFDVSDYLDGSDTVRFTYAEDPERVNLEYNLYFNVPIYPSFFMLDVETSDTIPPQITFIAPLNNTSIAGNTTTYINFTVDDLDATVVLEIEGIDVQISEVGGKWSYLWNLSSADWIKYNITAYATDSSGNTGSSTIFVDVTKPPPKLTITSPSNGSLISQKNNISIEVSVDDPNATISIEIDGEEVSNSTSFLWDPSAISEGLHIILAQATDTLDQIGSDSITVNVTAEDVVTTTTISGQTTTTIQGQTTLTTTPITSLTTIPPQTSPPVTAPPVRRVELAVNSLTLSTGSNLLKQGVDVTAYVLASNAGDSDIEATIVLFSDNVILVSITATLRAYEVKEREFFVRGSRLETGSHTLRARIVVQGENVEEIDPNNNERSIEVIVEEETSYLDSLKPILKWIAIIAVILVLARVIITFIFQREEDYLR